MPDNKSNGMVETFCRTLVPADSADLMAFAQVSALEARKRGANWKEAHSEKAAHHTFLAWRDPPGERFGVAIAKKSLDPAAPIAKLFAEWFIKLFEVPRHEKSL